MKLIYFFALIILFFACNKDNRENWFVFKITVKDYYTGEPVPFYTTFVYKENQGWYAPSKEKEMSFGSGNGELYVKQKMEKNQRVGDVIINGKNDYAVPNEYFALTIYNVLDKRGIYTGSDEDYTVYAKPKFKFRLVANNNNCFDETDTLFVKLGNIFGTLPVVGCGTHEYLSGGGPNYLCFTNDKYFQITLKRNGVITDLSQSFNLQKGIINTITIDY